MSNELDHLTYDLLDDLLKVGSRKPLGYLPLDTLIHFCGASVEDIKNQLQSRGLKVLQFRECLVYSLSRPMCEDECRIGSGALYAYDPDSLGQLLRANEAILVRCGWPASPHDFVKRVAQETAEDLELYELIARAFGDVRYATA